MAPDIAADNGTIQGIDRVLIPLDIPGNTNIVDIAAGSDDFNLLVRALQTANLDGTVRDADDITVFAPTDAAFTQLATDLGFDGDTADEDAVFTFLVAALTELGGGDPIPVLTDILLYHVAPGAQSAAEIAAADTVATLLQGASVTPDGSTLQDAEPDIADPQIVAPDIAADNVTIQGIDRVLIPLDIPGNTPPTITEIVAASGGEFDDNNGDFDILLNAVVAADLADTLNAPDADVTVFAPTDAGFISAAQALGFQGSDEAGAFNYIVQAASLLSNGGDPIPLIRDILLYHVSPGRQDAGDVLAASDLQTLLGVSIDVLGTELNDGDSTISNPNIIDTDIAASTGIVHVLDGVLFPQVLLPTNGDRDVDFIISDDGSDSFVLGADDDFIDAGAGNDTVQGDDGNDVIDGGDGVDTAVVTSDASDYALEVSQDGIAVTLRSAAATDRDFLVDTEFLEFGDGFEFLADGAIDLTVLSGAASVSGPELTSLVELYVAYFNRAPDALGLSFWANALSEGVSLHDIAALFFDQDEAREKMPPESEVGAFVDLAYAHLWDRAADDAGRAFWVDQLSAGNVSRPEFMLKLIEGAKAPTGSPDDVRTIQDKTDLAVAFAVTEGLTDAEDAAQVLGIYDRDDAANTLAQAQQLIEGFASDAAATDGTGDLTVQIVGVVDDPFV